MNPASATPALPPSASSDAPRPPDALAAPLMPAVPTMPLHLRVNGKACELRIETWVTLLDLLRDRLGLTGTKKGCDHGQCGACTVLADGRRINACLTLAVMQAGKEVTTVEGLAQPAGLHPLQQAFIDHDAFQCGYCTPGQLCSAAGLLAEHPPRSRRELRERMSGNLCRCGAYPQITEAIAQVLDQRPDASALAGSAKPGDGTPTR